MEIIKQTGALVAYQYINGMLCTFSRKFPHSFRANSKIDFGIRDELYIYDMEGEPEIEPG